MRKKYLTSSTRNGSFDFVTNIIEIEKYDFKYKNIIETVISKDISTSLLNTQEIDIMALIYHEITHFLDLTTTSWGLEYMARKTHFILKTRSDSMEVFKLNIAEIEMHDVLIEILDENCKVKLLDCSLQHHLVYNENFGSLIMIDFFLCEEQLYSIPFSMLSVLEANAYASEILVKIQNIENLQNEAEKTISCIMLNQEFDKFLNDIDYSEYNLVLILAKFHFQELNLKELLIFIKTLIGYVLNLGGMNISLASTFIKHTLAETHIGNAIVKDMQRGMSRHILVFKFILLMHSYLQIGDTKSKILSIKTDPKEFINNFIKDSEIPINNQLDSIPELNEFNITLKNLEKIEKTFDWNIIENSSKYNKKIIETQKNILFNIKDLKLMDIYLSDETQIKVPNRLDINLKKYSSDNIKLFSKIETLFKNSDMTKFHIHPNDVTYV